VASRFPAASEEVRDRYDAPDLNLARYIKDGTVTGTDNGE